MVAIGIFPVQGKLPTAEPGIEPGTSWLVVRGSDHQATRLLCLSNFDHFVFSITPIAANTY
jgi:hypothetical protein